MSSAAIKTASLSDVGRVRTHNEDCCGEFVSNSGSHLLVVADGMGGHQAGETASRLAVETIGKVFADSREPPERMLREALDSANERVFRMSTTDPNLRGMGTTAVALLIGADQTGWVAHVGDSRAYRCRGQQIEALTHDHSVVAELERRGLLTAEEAAVHPRRNEILRSVGVRADVEIDVSPIEVRPGDAYLLCSDGLSGLLGEREIADIVTGRTPPEAARLLVETANERGGHDNVTVQIASISSGEESAPAEPTSATPASATAEPARRRRRTLVVTAVLAAGLTALALLWWLYRVSS